MKPLEKAPDPSRVQPPGAPSSGFFVVSPPAINGAITQPLQMFSRQMQIKTVSLAGVSWVSIPRGSEKQSSQQGSAPMTVNRDKREAMSPVENTVDNLPTGRSSGACVVGDRK
jgi:hypothetical protein